MGAYAATSAEFARIFGARLVAAADHMESYSPRFAASGKWQGERPRPSERRPADPRVARGG